MLQIENKTIIPELNPVYIYFFKLKTFGLITGAMDALIAMRDHMTTGPVKSTRNVVFFFKKKTSDLDPEKSFTSNYVYKLNLYFFFSI